MKTLKLSTDEGVAKKDVCLPAKELSLEEMKDKLINLDTPYRARAIASN